MRAKEFTINVPINIKINGDGDPEIDVAGSEPKPEDADPVFVGPQQQELELQKADRGKKSIVSAQITDDAEDGEVN
tara:strand:- start:219 stop:446 length:228 start_codon:yes stop_codon:yes gene_type:complete